MLCRFFLNLRETTTYMKQQLLFPLLLGFLGFFLTTPYNMGGSLFISCMAIMGHYFLYGIALKLKWQYSPLQMAVFWLAQPLLSLITVPFEGDFSHIQAEIPYLFPVIVPTFTLVAGISLAVGYLWTLEKKALTFALTLLWLCGGFFLWKEALPRMSFQQNLFISAEKVPTSLLKGLNQPDFTPEMYKGKKSYFLCWEPVMWTDERQLRQFQRLYDLHKNDANIQMALIVCHSKEDMEQAQIDHFLGKYTFPKYEDRSGEWLAFVSKHRQEVGVLIDEKGEITHEITADFQNQGQMWFAEMGDLLNP